MMLTREKPALRHVRKAPQRLKRFLGLKRGYVGFFIIATFVFVALAAPLLAPAKDRCARDLETARFVAPSSCYLIPRESFSNTPTPPGREAVLGTVMGYDIFYGLVWGTRTAFWLALLVVGSTLLIGLVVGSVSGYAGGWLDNVLMRLTDVVFALPSLVVTIVLVTLLGQGLGNVVISMILFGWAGYARLLRGEVLRVRSLEYVEGAKALGASHPRIILNHILPNSLTTLVVQVALDLGSVVLQVSALSFLGLGAPIGYADWGQIINFAQGFILGPPNHPFAYWYVSLFPGLTILLWGLGWNFMGDALRDALDPKGR